MTRVTRFPPFAASIAFAAKVLVWCAHQIEAEDSVRFLLLVLAWFILLAVSWPLALLVLVLAPVLFLLFLPFLLLGLTVGALFALVKQLLFLPARILGYRASPQ